MLRILVLSLALVGRIQAAADPVDVDDILRSDLEGAAKDSQDLADELAAMLARLEDSEERTEEVEIEVLEENAEVEVALKDMIDKIENLATLEKEVEIEQIGEIATQQKTQGEELAETLEELKEVAKEIEIVAGEDALEGGSSLEEALTLQQMAKTLQDVSARIRGVEAAVGSKKNTSAKKETKTEKTEEASDSQKKSPDFKLELDNLVNIFGDNSDAEDADSTTEKVEVDSDETTVKPRRGKQLDEGLADFGSSEGEGSDESGSDEERSGKEVEDSKESYEPEEPKETCESKTASNRVQICTPGFSNKESYVQFYSKEIKDDQHCFKVTRTECEQTSQDVTKEVCFYEYQQKTAVAPAFVTELGYERRFEKLQVSNCKKEIVKDGYKEKEVETCYLEDVEAAYRIPTISEYIEDFVELSAYVPEKKCRVIKYEIPEVECKDVSEKSCTIIQTLEPANVKAEISDVVQDYHGNCDYRELEQDQQICTVEEKVKRPNYPRAPQYSYSG